MIKRTKRCKTNVSKKNYCKSYKKIILSILLLKFSTSYEVGQMLLNERIFLFIFLFLFYLCIYPPDSQVSDGGANT